MIDAADIVPVRAATAEDAAAVLATVHAAFAEHRGRLVPETGALRETLDTVAARIRRGDVLVAGAGPQLPACAFVAEHEGDFYLGRLSVRPEQRGEGLARALVEAALALGRERGFSHVVVGVRLALPANLGFFGSLGFRPHELGYHDGAREPTFLWLRRPLEDAS